MRTRFFQQPSSQLSEIELNSSFEQDGYIRAMAVCLVDKLVSRSYKDSSVSNVLLDKLASCFPDSIPDAKFTTPVDTLELMTSTPKKASRTALELTWVSRQLMVDAMCEALVHYLPAFYKNDTVVKPSKMRTPGVEVDNIGLKALANLLNVTIVVHRTEKNMQLPAVTTYGQGELKFNIDEHNGRYSPRVNNKEAFRPLSSLSIDNPDLSVDEYQDDNLAKQVISLMHRIAQANKENANWLQNMLEDGSITYDDLLELYTTRAVAITWEQEFMEPSTELNELLVNTSAAMISFGITSREELFEAEVEQTPSSPTMV